MAAASLTSVASAAGVPIGNRIVVVSSTGSIVTGDSWQVVAEVDDLLGNPVSGATVWTGIKEPSVGCGSDLTASSCTALAVDKETTDSSGRVTLARPAALNTFVVLYLSNLQGALDSATGQSVLIHTHNNYAWAGPSTATLPQYAIGKAPHILAPGKPGSNSRIATGTGAATAPLTQVSTDAGATWTTVAHGINGGAFPVTGSKTPPVNYVNLMASKPGTYSVRITDNGGTFEAPGVSSVATVTVTPRSAPAWLRRTNAFRSSLGLAPVADNPVYDAAVAKHVHWMNLHQTLSHVETPGTAGYSTAGNQAAVASDLAGGHPTAASAVDGWMGAPFHASCLLNAYWAVGGFAIQNGWAGEWCHSDLQTFDLATGSNGPARSSLRRNYTFPSAAMKVPLSVALNGNEAPDPVAGCARKGVGPYWSVPAVFRVARPPASDRGLHNARATIKSKSGHRITHACLITGSTYRGPDPGSTQLGRAILGDRVTGRWAVLLVKAGALHAGHSYTAALTDGRFAQRTTFKLARR